MTRRYLVAGGIAAAVVVVDFVSKRWAESAFADGSLELIPDFLVLTYVENPGAAFSFFTNAGPYIGVAAIIVAGGVLWALRKDRPSLEVVAFGFVIGGAVGNLVDRILRGDGFLDGKVIDWIDLWWIPTFNVADMAVTTAVSLLLIHAWLTR